MEDIINQAIVSDNPFVLAAIEHAVLHGELDRAARLAPALPWRPPPEREDDGTWSRCAICGDPGPDPMPDPDPPDDFDIA